jgi:hypothetical protein
MENGKDLECTNMPLNLRDDNGWLMFTMFAQASESEWKGIQARNRSSRIELRQRGRWSGGPVAYWLKPVHLGKEEGWTLALDSESAAITERLIAGYLAKRPVDVVCRELDADGVLSPEDHRRVRAGNEPKGIGWNSTSVEKILSNPALYGVQTEQTRFKAFSTRLGREVWHREYRVVRHETTGEPVMAAEALITPAKFEEIQAETSRRKALTAPRREENVGALLGVLQCLECSGPGYHQTQHDRTGTKTYRYYRFPCKHSERFPAAALERQVRFWFALAVGATKRVAPVYIPAEDNTVELEQAEAAFLDLSGRLPDAPTEVVRRGLQGQLDALTRRITTLAGRPRVEARVEYRETGETYADVLDREDDSEIRGVMLDAGFRVKIRKHGGRTEAEGSLPDDVRERLGLSAGAPLWEFGETVARLQALPSEQLAEAVEATNRAREAVDTEDPAPSFGRAEPAPAAAIDIPGALAAHLAESELEPLAQKAFDGAQVTRRGRHESRRVTASVAVHRYLLERCWTLAGGPGVEATPAERRAYRTYSERIETAESAPAGAGPNPTKQATDHVTRNLQKDGEHTFEPVGVGFDTSSVDRFQEQAARWLGDHSELSSRTIARADWEAVLEHFRSLRT